MKVLPGWWLLRNTEDGRFFSEMLVNIGRKKMINGMRAMHSISLIMQGSSRHHFEEGQ